MEGALQVPIIDLSSIDLSDSLKKACIENGYFYLINHEVEGDLIRRVFDGSRGFFDLSIGEKMKVLRKNHRGYTPFYDEKLDLVDNPKGDPKESIYFGAPEDISPYGNLNQWPTEEILPCWRSTMEEYYRVILNLGKRVLSLIALALNVNEDFFEKVGAFNPPGALLRPMHYPDEINYCDQYMHGCGAHTDYGMITILITDGVPGLQVAMFFDPSPDCVVECLKSCCSESPPPRFPPVRVADYLKEHYIWLPVNMCNKNITEEEMRTG
ncbi:2-oxoglutarate-Fe(II) type oxidoreductase hxnY-like isoform X4 [Solanum lycopersicum]|uniref:2-oxoglutarate-Fe(II) type oxidoreductase hxnY-like isoform X4 n=1 Tax=Solanum lycopersicum TaxID=4081 RepID=UPI000E1D90A5|nr:2-oxoglutarate-Fe(II) type oxidoreductase hxnY-like isoform X4 [Solanum lycopersicum]